MSKLSSEVPLAGRLYYSCNAAKAKYKFKVEHLKKILTQPWKQPNATACSWIRIMNLGLCGEANMEQIATVNAIINHPCDANILGKADWIGLATLQILEEGSEARGWVFIRRLDGRRLHLREGGPKLLRRFYSSHEQAIIPFLPSLSPLSAPLTSDPMSRVLRFVWEGLASVVLAV